MFSWIIEHTAKILSMNHGTFRVENTFSEPLTVGQSIAHDGACMTITKLGNDDEYEFFAMEETLRVTNFWHKRVGDVFNVERCIRVGDRLDGHFVTGHIDTVGTISLIDHHDDGSKILGITYEERYSSLIIEKGSITLNGVSLTIVELGTGYLSVSLIPLTQQWTNLGKCAQGDRINIEFDMVGKYIQKFTSFSV